MTGPRRAAAALLAAVLLALAGCSWVPTNGPVVNVAPLGTTQSTEGAEFVPSGPGPGDSPTSIVEGFLEAMQATPVQTTVAREFLTKNAASTWSPQQGTLVYSARSRASGRPGSLAVRLSGTSVLDSRGALQASSTAPTLHFTVVREGGQWRIAQAPDRLVVPESWFQTRFAQVSLYFFDPTARILVPEPVLLPAGPQLPTELISDLLRGPAPGLQRVERTFLPSGVSGGLSVPVSDGLAQVSLSGTADISDTSARMMAAQISWTLGQVGSVRAVQITLGGREITIGNSSTIPVTAFAEYDPAGPDISSPLYGLRAGVVVRSTGQGFAAAPGSWGHDQSGLRAIAVGPGERRLAGVSLDGRSLVVGPLGGAPRTYYSGIGTDLLRPAWDFAGRVWLLDRNRGRARISYLADGRLRPVAIPGVTGRNVSDFQVSFDGTRVVAVVRGGQSDQVMVSRVQQDAHGGVTGGTPARLISDVSEGPLRVSATVWHSPTEIVILQQFSGTSLIRALTVDGSTTVYPGMTVTVGDRIRALVGSPRSDNALYAVTPRQLLDLSGHGDNLALPSGVSSIGYIA